MVEHMKFFVSNQPTDVFSNNFDIIQIRSLPYLPFIQPYIHPGMILSCNPPCFYPKIHSSYPSFHPSYPSIHSSHIHPGMIPSCNLICFIRPIIHPILPFILPDLPGVIPSCNLPCFYPTNLHPIVHIHSVKDINALNKIFFHHLILAFNQSFANLFLVFIHLYVR